MRFLILFLLISMSSLAQRVDKFPMLFNGDSRFVSKLDSILFVKINEYRVSKNLKALKWDSIAYKESKHHDLYSESTLKNKGTIGHGEDSSIFRNSDDRYVYYGGNKKDWTLEVLMFSTYTLKNEEYDKLATFILDCWKSSEGHNKAILSPESNYGGGCTLIKDHIVISTFCLVEKKLLK